jgi:hypothetical protein
MRRWLTLSAALLVAFALLAVTGDSPRSVVRGQTPASSPAATPDLAAVRQQFISFFSGMQQVVTQARQNDQTRAALDAGLGDPSAIFAQAQQTIANATPDQLTALQKVLQSQPNLPKLPDQLKAQLAAQSSGAAPNAAAAAPRATAAVQTSTDSGTLTGGDCPSGLKTLEAAVVAAPSDPTFANNFNAPYMLVSVFGFEQGVSALQAIYNAAVAFSPIVFTLVVNPVALAAAIAQGVLNVFSLLSQQTFQAVLDCITWGANSWLYTQDKTGTYQTLALESDLKKLTGSSETQGLGSGSCNGLQSLPKAVTVQLSDPSQPAASTNTANGLLDDLKQMVADTYSAMSTANLGTGSASGLIAAGNQAYTAQQWKLACQDYAQAYVQLTQ